VPTRRIVNASPLILLTKIGRIDLLQAEGVEVIVPMVVLEEVSCADPSDPAVRAIHEAGWQVETLSDPVPDSVKRWGLDAGEEAVIALALGCTDREVVLDDLAGRRCAEAHGIPLIGTLGLVVLAKRIGRIAEARPVIEELRRAGLRASEAVIANALGRADE
jgi:predicted nucleic acid-binding protein